MPSRRSRRLTESEVLQSQMKPESQLPIFHLSILGGVGGRNEERQRSYRPFAPITSCPWWSGRAPCHISPFLTSRRGQKSTFSELGPQWKLPASVPLVPLLAVRVDRAVGPQGHRRAQWKGFIGNCRWCTVPLMALHSCAPSSHNRQLLRA